MIGDIGKAANSTWGEKLALAEMLSTFLCLTMASSHTNRFGVWSDVGAPALSRAFEVSGLLNVGKGLTVVGMLLSISGRLLRLLTLFKLFKSDFNSMCLRRPSQGTDMR